MFTLEPTPEMKSVLPLALSEIETTFFSENALPSDDNLISDLVDQLETFFSPISDRIYSTKIDDYTRKSLLAIPLSERVPLPGVDYQFSEFAPSPEVIDRKRYIHKYPTVYLNKMLLSNHHNTVKILPYLLTAYYIHFRNDRVIGSADGSHKLNEFSKEDALFISVDKTVNFKRSVKNYCKKFSLKDLIPYYSKRKDLQSYLSTTSNNPKPDIASYLRHAPFSILHYRSLFYTWIYAACVLCCTRVPELSARIDYVLATDLFYSHSLAFATRLSEDAPILISDLFSDEDANLFSEPLAQNLEAQLKDMGISKAEYCLPSVHSTIDLYKCVLLTLSAMLHPDYCTLFCNASFLHALIEKGYSTNLNKIILSDDI